MARKDKTLLERGIFKQTISSSLFKNQDLLHVICDGNIPESQKEKIEIFKDQVKSHIFIDDTVDEQKTFIFYDVDIQEEYGSDTIKNCTVTMYAITHKDMIDNYNVKENSKYVGNRIDILLEIINDILINDKDIANKFGIGELRLASTEVVNLSRFYGSIIKFKVPNFI